MILTRDGCHLCAEALALAEAICSDAGASLLALDVDADALRSALAVQLS